MVEVRLSLPEKLKMDLENIGRALFGEKGRIKKTVLLAIEEFVKKRKKAKNFLEDIELLDIRVGGKRKDAIGVKKIWEK